MISIEEIDALRDMKYKPVKTFNEGDIIEQVFLIAQASKGFTKRGDPFTTFILQDESGRFPCKQWRFDFSEYPELKAGTYAKMKIKVDEYQGSLQGNSLGIPMPVEPPTDTSSYELHPGVSPEDATAYYDKLMGYKDQVENPFIKAYLDTIFEDNIVVQKLFKIAPASISNRGAYRGGLVEHVYKVMLNAVAIVESQQLAHNPAPIDMDIVVAGVLTHDLGKMYAYEVTSTGVAHTRSGSLLNHLPLSYSISIQAFMQTESIIHREIPEEIKDHINHCILSHHGQLEYGSPVKPQSIEAHIVHVADMSDSTSSNFAEPIVANLDGKNEDGFIEGSYFSAKTIYVGDKQPNAE
jgi:3'-5' exoribonuclease